MQLPTCGSTTNGQRYIVTDAMTPTFHATLTGGGTGSSAVVGALCNGTSWIAD